MNDEIFDFIIKEVFLNEGGYTDGLNQVKDMPTNMGIQQKTLDYYNTLNPSKGFPKTVKNLQLNQAKEIYKNLYWDNTMIPKIRNFRIKKAVFDMNVMGGAGVTVQRALNEYLNAKLKIDGVIGNATIEKLNSISEVNVDSFMEVLSRVRLEYLKKTPNWITSKNGWEQRTNRY